MMRSATNGRTICIAEDDPEVRSYLETALLCQGYSVEAVQDGEELLAYLQAGYPKVSAVLLDLIMPRKDGMETLREIRGMHKDLPVVMISGASSPLNIVEAMRNGATDFLGKPVSHEDLRNALERTIEEKPRPRPEVSKSLLSPSPKEAFVSANPQMREIEAVIDQVAWSGAPVLIQGETGVGKEVLARALHARSPRAGKPLIKLNCAALPSELVESELFGYERGAFTGAFQKKPGMFELADGGTLLLDEIGDMDYKLQAKLLQVLQDQAFQRLGGKETVQVDVRIVAATHNNLEKAMLAGRFREASSRSAPPEARRPWHAGSVHFVVPWASPSRVRLAGQHPGTREPDAQSAHPAQAGHDRRRVAWQGGPKDSWPNHAGSEPTREGGGAHSGAVHEGQAAGGIRGDPGRSQRHTLEPQTGRCPAEDRVQGIVVQNEKTWDR
jgi:CheY-like chemotaxis protein